nr:MAG TPA: hypothetical protein [Caudoviricetes sp.]
MFCYVFPRGHMFLESCRKYKALFVCFGQLTCRNICSII